jgi:hypothetical protein
VTKPAHIIDFVERGGIEYALRAGSQTRYPWGEGTPPPDAKNVTGGLIVHAKDEVGQTRMQGTAIGGGPAPTALPYVAVFTTWRQCKRIGRRLAGPGYRRHRRPGPLGQLGCQPHVPRWILASAPAQVRFGV